MSFSLASIFNNSILCEELGSLNPGFIVPNGVTEIGFEIWGGGGGGGMNGAGQGGGFLQGSITVKTGMSVSITTGKGGDGGNGQFGGTGVVASAGGDTTMNLDIPNVGRLSATALGGAADGAFNPQGYTLLINKLVTRQFGLVGEFCRRTQDVQLLYGTDATNTAFTNTTYKCADGGNAANTIYTAGYGAFCIIQYIKTGTFTVANTLLQGFASVPGNIPGGGGGSGMVHAGSTGQPNILFAGAQGAKGRGIIYY